MHALLVALAMALAFTVLVLAFGPALYRLLGGKGESLANAAIYSNILFGGALTVWLANTLASVLRGKGNMLIPALALIGAAIVQVPLCGSLVLGIGPMPRLGIAGAGIAYVLAFGLAAVPMAVAVFRPASTLRPRHADFMLEKRLFADILRVGGLSVLNSFVTVATAVALTGFVGRFGPAALAGYGVGVRLELLQIPLVFAVGQALVVLVGTNIGAGNIAPARRIAWLGALLAGGICLVIGWTAALFPLGWVGLFSSDAAVLEVGARYLHIAAPFYPLLGVNVALYFASQGAGQMLMPVLAGMARLVIVLIGGAVVMSLGAIFGVIALGLAIGGALMIWFVARTSWSS